MNQIKDIKSKMDSITFELNTLSAVIEKERRDSSEEEFVIKNEFIEKKIILEEKLESLKKTLNTALKTENDPNKINLGDTALIEMNGKRQEYVIVNSEISDPELNRISADSPIGKALFGKTKGDDAELNTPIGKKKFKIIDFY